MVVEAGGSWAANSAFSTHNLRNSVDIHPGIHEDNVPPSRPKSIKTSSIVGIVNPMECAGRGIADVAALGFEGKGHSTARRDQRNTQRPQSSSSFMDRSVSLFGVIVVHNVLNRLCSPLEGTTSRGRRQHVNTCGSDVGGFTKVNNDTNSRPSQDPFSIVSVSSLSCFTSLQKRRYFA
jgi:hypothetical protein